MDSLIYSLNATVPVFLVMVVGYVLRQMKWVNDDFINASNKINFKLTLPCLLLLDMMDMDIGAQFDIKYILYCAIVTSISFWGIWGLAKIFIKDKTIIGAFVQASFRSSAAVLGTAFIINIYGNAGMAPLMMLGSVPLYNIYSVIVLTFEANSEQEKTIKKAFIEILKNPIIISIFAGLLLSLLKVTFPPILESTISSLAKLATPLALIAIGAGFEGRKAIKKIKPTVVASIIKLLILPLLFMPVAIMLGFDGSKLIALVIMLGAPTTPSCYIMAKNMDNDEVLTSSIVVMTTILSAFTITLILFILRFNGLV